MDEPGGLDGPEIIEPIAFRSTPTPTRSSRSTRRPLGIVIAVTLAVVVGVSGWFLLTARRVTLTFEPDSYRVGLPVTLAASVLTGIGLVGWALLAWRRGARQN